MRGDRPLIDQLTRPTGQSYDGFTGLIVIGSNVIGGHSLTLTIMTIPPYSQLVTARVEWMLDYRANTTASIISPRDKMCWSPK